LATSLYFNNFNSKAEQNLIENLVIESIRIYGIDVYYVPRVITAESSTFTEAVNSAYDTAVNVEMYVKSIDGFDGDGEFLSSFGVQVQEEITFSIAYRTFETNVGAYLRRDRPLEGDLIWFAPYQGLFQIKYVEMRPVFYQMGALQFYDITCELFQYSNEIFNTGVPDIDIKYNTIASVSQAYDLFMEDGFSVLETEDGAGLYEEEYVLDTLDPGAQNAAFGNNVLTFVDFSEIDPFSESQTRI